MERLEYLVQKFSENIFFDDSVKLKEDYIKIFEEYLKLNIDKRNKLIEEKFLYKLKKNDFIEMTDFLKYEMLPYAKRVI